MTKEFITDYGTVTVRNAMFDVDGTTLEEGIEVKGDSLFIERYGQYDIDEMSVDDVETIIETERKNANLT